MQTRITLLTFLLLCTGYLLAQESYQVNSAEISISGTSTLHDWVSTTNEMTAAGDLAVKEGKLLDVTALQVTVPVLSIKSGKGNPMDKKTYKALLSEEHPNITFKLQDISAIKNMGMESQIEANGLLTIAGQSQDIQLMVTAISEEGGIFRFSGSKALLMSDFGIDPPTALFGTLKTGNEITVSFNVSLTRNNQEH